MTKRVAIDYSDGWHSMYDPSSRSMAEGVDREAWNAACTIEISEAEWLEYQAYLEQHRRWNERCLALNNQIWERNNGQG